MLGIALAVARNRGTVLTSGSRAAQTYIQHVQGEVIAVARLRWTIAFVLPEVAVAVLDADLEIGQIDGAKVSNKDGIPERPDSGNFDRQLDLLDQ